MTGLTLTPPSHGSGDFSLTFNATSTENGLTASVNTTAILTIEGEATTPILTVNAAAGNEDSVIPLGIHAALADTDGSETLSILIGNVPAGATLSAGTRNADGTWTLTAGQLTNLTLTPPLHFSGAIDLSVTAIALENGTTAAANTTLAITVAGTATLPLLSVQAAAGLENTAIPLTIHAALADTDGSETLSIAVTGIPAGAVLSAGTHNADGSWTLAAGDLTGLTLTPPPHYSGLINLGVTASSAENGTVAAATAALSVTVSGVADTPTLSVQPAAGNEGTALTLHVNAALSDPDGSESLSVIVSGLPIGASLSAGTHNADGSYTLTAAQLSGLTMTPPASYSGAFNLNISAIASEDGTTASIATILPVTIAGVASPPVLSVQAAAGVEDTSIPLLLHAALSDTDGSETLSVTVAGLPAGATLSAGTHNADGSYTLTVADLANLTLTPPQHYSGNFNLSVTATSSENGTTSSVSANLGVSVTGVATTPLIAVQAAAGMEGTAVPLVISAALADTDGSETLGITVAGLPIGATLSAGTHNADGSYTLTAAQLSGLTLTPPAHWAGNFDLTVTATSSENTTTANASASLSVMITGTAQLPTLSVQSAGGLEDHIIPLHVDAALVGMGGAQTLDIIIGNLPAGATLSAGTHNSDGTYTLSVTDLSGLTLTPPAHWSGSVNLSVTAISTDNGDTASTWVALPLTVTGVADTPTLSVQAASGNEDSAIALHINAALTDTDGSETLSVMIAGVPAGATLSAGTHNTDGSYTLNSTQLTGLTLTPPGNFSGNISLSITATSSEAGTTASTSTLLPVTVTGVADIPTLSVQAAAGLEDHAIALHIAAASTDLDGSESLSVTVAGIPAGATLSAGIHNADGSYTLTSSQLTGLTMTPPASFSGNVNLTVTAVASENGTSANLMATLPVTITGVADTPVLSVQAASGLEDQAIALHIAAGSADPDGSEALEIVIAGVPAGATLSAGTHNANGTYTLTSSQLSGLTLTPPANFSGAIGLTVTATTSEDGTTASTTATLPIIVTGVADAPILSVQAAAGNEDAAIALHINAASADTDGSETLFVIVAGLPIGATLSAGTHNADGTYTLTAAQLSGLSLTPPANFSGSVNLTVTATTLEDGTTASTTVTLPVTVTGVADTPALSVQAAAGLEDHAIALNIIAASTDLDGSETLAVVIAGIPAGAVLSAGTHNADGTYTLTAAQLSGLTMRPPANFSGSVNLSVTATTSENGTAASTTATLPVTVTGVADTPSLSVQAAAGNEDAVIALHINAALADTDGSETLSVTVAGVPAGATLSAGTHNADGTYTLTSAQLSGLTLTPPLHWSGSFDLSVTATSSEGGTSASSVAVLPIAIAGVATIPILSVQAATGIEGAGIPLAINAALADTDGSESLAVTVGNLPAGATLSAGTHNADGTYTLTAAQLSGLTLTPSLHWNGIANLSITATSSENGTTASTTSLLPLTITAIADAPSVSVQAATGTEDTAIALHINAALAGFDVLETLSINISGIPAGATLSAGIHNADGTYTLTAAQLSGLTMTPPSNYSGSFSLLVTATASELGTSASAAATLPVTITGVADIPTLSLQAASGTEDTAVPLHISSALTDLDGSETLSITIGNLPVGATLSAGAHNADGTYTLTPAQLSGLTLTPPANWSGSVGLSVTATSAEAGTTATLSSTLPLTITGVADAPTLSVIAATGAEDTAIALHINAALTDTDGSEALAIIIAGLPSGATLSAGIHNADGTYTLTPAQLSGLTLTPPANFSGSVNLSITATSSEAGTAASTSLSLPVTVTGVADVPTLSVQAATGTEDSAIALHINAGLTDTDGSETLAITVGNLPAGATLSTGTRNADGSYTLTSAQLSGLTLTPPVNWSGSVGLSVTATSAEAGTIATISSTLPLTITGVADTPTLSVIAAAGAEDTAIALHIAAALTDTDGMEALAITIAGIPSGAILSAGIHNADGTYTLTSAQLSGLTLTPPPNFSGSVNLTVTATSSEAGTVASTSLSLPVTVTGVADVPTLSVQAATGTEDSAIALHINAGLTDTDGSETLSVIIGNLPAGATLSSGTHNADGTYTLTLGQLSGLTLTPPANWSGTANLSVTATSSEAGTTASAMTTLPLTVTGVADLPTLSVQASSGNEDTAIALHINAALTDTDGSESLAITIAGVPAEAILSAGTHNADGTYTLTAPQLSGLTLTPPANFSGSLNLSVTATSSEDGTAAHVTSTLPVTVTGIADVPTLSIQAASGNEDTAIALHINAGLVDSAETLSVTVAGVPANATLSAGTRNADGTYTLTVAQLSGLTLMPALNFSGNLTLTATATSSQDGTTASASLSLPVAIAGVADTPTLSVQAATGNEDDAIPLHINAGLTDTDGSETLSVIIGGLPTGATLSAGTHNADGTYTLTAPQLSGLTLTPGANWSGTSSLSVTALSSENGTTASTTATLPLTVNGIADVPTLSVQAATGNEDTAIALHISAALTDLTGHETLSVIVGGLPTGATLSAGTHNADGTYTLTSAQLSVLTLTPPLNWSGSASLTITAISSDSGTTASTSTTLPLTVSGIADVPTLSVTSASGNEDTAMALHINAALTDTDGSESLTIVIGGMPAGASLSAGIHNADGTYTLTSAQLSGLTLTPPPNFSGSMNLSVTAISSENGTTASAATMLGVTVAGVADVPTLGVTAAAGNEDTAIALHINAGLTDADGSEILTIVIGGLPTGTVLSAGTHNTDGTYTLTSAQLSGLTLTPPSNWSGSASLTVTATSSENGTTASTTTTLPLTVTGVADTPTLSVQAATGNEDDAIPLHINAGLTDTDGSETLSVIIGGLPTGATLSAGTHNADGTYALTAAQLSGLTLTPAANFSGSLNLSVTATSSEAGTTASTTATLPVTIGGIADTPSLRIQAASGNEDSAIALHIAAALTDTDGSESLAIAIGGLPTGATLSAGTNNGDGTYTLTAAQLTGLTLTPPTNWSGTFTLAVTASSAENGTTATATIPLPVTVISVADTPTLTVAAATGLEDAAIPLTIHAGLGDSSESLSVMIAGIPSGATLSAGIYAGNGHWSLAASDLSSLTITPPANYSGTMALTVTSVSTASNGDTATLALPVNVTVTPVADIPTLSLAAAAGKEDTAIALGINAALSDTDGSENLTVSIAGIPTGATLVGAGVTLTGITGGVWTGTTAQLSGLTITPPANSDADFTLTVTATSRDGASNASVTGTIPVTVLAVADIPTVSAANATGPVNTSIPLTISGAVTDTDGSEGATFIIHGIPDGFALNNGSNNGDNSWTLTQSELANLTLISPPTFNGQLNLYAQAVAHDNDGSSTVSAATSFYVRVGTYATGYLVDLGVNAHVGGVGVGVHVGALPDIDLFQAIGGITQTAGIYVKEDTSFKIADAPSLLALPVISNLVGAISKISFAGVPAGTVFTNGTTAIGVNKGGGVWEFTTAQLNNLYIGPPPNSDVDFTLSVTAKMLYGLADITLAPGGVLVHVMGVADVPTLSASIAATTEDHTAALTIAGASTDTDGSEAMSYLVSGLPTGFTLNHGIDNGNGTWSLHPADLTGLTVAPAANYSGSVTLTISAIATEQVVVTMSPATTTGQEGDQTVVQTTVTLNVAAIADAPVVAPVKAVGTEDHAVALNLGIALKDTDGSEHISLVTIGGLPTGATLTGATDNHNGTWSADVAHLDQVQFVPAANWHGDASLTISATSLESSNASAATTTATIAVHVEAVADTPVTTATDSSGTMGQAIGLHVSAALTDASEHLSTVISGVPHDAVLSAGLNNGDGSWTLTASQLAAVQITTADHFTGDLALSLTGYSREDNGSMASSSQNFTVHVAAASGSATSGSWLDATVSASGGAPSATPTTPTDDAHAAITAAATTAHTAGSDYQQAFQSHQTG